MTLDDDEKCPLCVQSIEASELDWILCNLCLVWYHCKCADLTKEETDRISEYHCLKCQGTKHAGPSVMKRKSKRHQPKVDYVALNDGDEVRFINKHPHISHFEQFQNDRPIHDLIYVVRPNDHKTRKTNGIINDDIMNEIINETQLTKPILLPSANPHINTDPELRRVYQLDFKFPKDLTVSEVVELVGKDTAVEVMDVLTQENSSWTMLKWRDYYNTDPNSRDRIRNVISLEVSDSVLEKLIQIPRFVKDIDIVDCLWSSSVFQDHLNSHAINVTKPKVTKYCLMSVENSFTDFHIDFGGTSVYYTVLRGRKTFILYPPTKQNLKSYEQWCNMPDQNKVWFGSLVKPQTKPVFPSSYNNNGIKIEVMPGDLLILPSGWIHAVFTPEDSLVIGGNFLSYLNIPTHLLIYDIEYKTKVPEKYKFPSFNKLIWLVGYFILKGLESGKWSSYETQQSLLTFYQAQLSILTTKSTDKSTTRIKSIIKNSIPCKLIGNVEIFLDEFQDSLKCLKKDRPEEPKLKRIKMNN
ncbi:BA75_01241T0 [Komagataella pastoris]|uniref:JmjC domain-containing histone demethylation protein 1 n=1 Tax=Komagataella pastoris TaxID=4922 RepID=A0A1B2J5Y6_PICPA|nr:BA75_01241T0 [Komagataella pastoris]